MTPSLLHPRRVGVCGSSSLEPSAAPFCDAFGARLAEKSDAVLVSGGCKRKGGHLSADWHFAVGFERQLGDTPTEERMETLLPGRDESIEHFQKGRTRTLKNKTPMARRFAFVQGVDALVAVAGGEGSHQNLELADALNRLILPVPVFEGHARQFWDREPTRVTGRLHIDQGTADRWRNAKAGEPDSLRQLAREMADCLIAALPLRCMVIMPFQQDFYDLYERAIEPALERRGFTPIRTDRLEQPGDVTEQILSGIRNSDCAIAVLDGLRPNVLYELGLAHGRGKPCVLLLSKGQSARQGAELPFDISHHSAILYEEVDEALTQRIETALSHINRA